MIGESEVLKIARLARLALSPAESATLRNDVNKILGFFTILRECDVSDVHARNYPNQLSNVFRDDTASSLMETEKALQLAPDTMNNMFKVPIVVE